MIYELNTAYGGKVRVQPRVDLYTVKDFMGKEMPGIAVQLDEVETGMPFATLTKSFGEFIGLKNAAYIDMNNCPFAKDLLKEGIATDSRMFKQSGYGCVYPLWIFEKKFLKEHGAENYQQYSKAYDKYMGIERQELDLDATEGFGFVMK